MPAVEHWGKLLARPHSPRYFVTSVSPGRAPNFTVPAERMCTTPTTDSVAMQHTPGRLITCTRIQVRWEGLSFNIHCWTSRCHHAQQQAELQVLTRISMSSCHSQNHPTVNTIHCLLPSYEDTICQSAGFGHLLPSVRGLVQPESY